jgi:hypothetical protein
MKNTDMHIRIPTGNIIVSDATDMETAAARIRAALENADGICVDWGEVHNNDTGETVEL